MYYSQDGTDARMRRDCSVVASYSCVSARIMKIWIRYVKAVKQHMGRVRGSLQATREIHGLSEEPYSLEFRVLNRRLAGPLAGGE